MEVSAYYTAHCTHIQPGQLCDGAGREVASLLPSGLLRRSVHASRHMLRKPPSWAIETSILKEAQARGCWGVALVDLDNGRRLYFAPLSLFWSSRAIRIRRGNFPEQLALRLDLWAPQIQEPKSDDRQTAQRPTAQPATPVQLSLFEG
jgi:hypothetical protein